MAAFNTILPLSFAAGINLYLTVLVVGFSVRYGWVPDVPAGLHVFGSAPVLIAAGVLYVIQFFVDKIPFVDNLWDFLHTFIRPIGAVVVVTAGLTGIGAYAETVAALLAGAVALTSHTGKAGTRTAVNVGSPVENISNIVISLLEDLLVAALAFFALRFPLVANGITIVLLVLLITLVPQLLRWAWFTAGATIGWLRSLVAPRTQPDPLPAEHAALLSAPALLSVQCQAQNARLIGGKQGYLIPSDTALLFTYRRWFRKTPDLWRVPLADIVSVTVRPRPLLLVLEVTRRKQAQPVRFACSRDRRQIVEQLVATVQADISTAQASGNR
ncbi:MAG: DUF4126 domain-containing protein [Chloroflexaceae bacterium]|nr:DUF4126 domain-containing protein [Chloroflexaceae bacterium]NJO04353.1 DUF4126 domain-containing protein [Chloroflexaceae bacterium]